MKELNIDLEYCYGIRKLQTKFDFSNAKVFAIYAPNGSMKTSFAETFNDVAKTAETRDRIFSTRICKRIITEENGIDLSENKILVIPNYDEYFEAEKTSTLLVNNQLRKEYEEIHIEIDKSKDAFLKAIREQSGSKKKLEEEISNTFTKKNDRFYDALIRVKDEVLNQDEIPFANIQYDIIFDDKVIKLLENDEVRREIKNYIEKYDQLLAASLYFRKGTFDYYNASTISTNLAKNGFFEAKHSVNLNAEKKLEITSQEQLEELIEEEKEKISNDRELKKIFANIDKLITKNTTTRDFKAYLEQHEYLLPMLNNLDDFREEIWKSYFRNQVNLFIDLINKYQASEKRKKEIENEAEKQRTQWEEVIDIFNNRFIVPFKLIAENRTPVILGKDPVLNLGYMFDEVGENPVQVEKSNLIRVLSRGEKKALYILNIIFEIEARKKANQETIFIIDDIADSFDYRNKYAIIQYLQDIDKEPNFFQIILTHNFDFFRTIMSRFVRYSNCMIAHKHSGGISLEKACGIKNVFVNDWKKNFFSDNRKKIASIPFLRNLIEYVRGDQDSDYVTLTSLLHWKSDSASLTQNDLDKLFIKLFNVKKQILVKEKTMIDIIKSEANDCLSDDISINFENKIVLSIAIRLFAEKYMVEKINDQAFLDSISSNQTPKLLQRYSELFNNDEKQIKIINRVILMTPENLHLNSFMYEPILDMSDEHLKALYSDVLTLA